MIHWDPVAKTALSDDEVVHKQVQGQLCYVRYAVSGRTQGTRNHRDHNTLGRFIAALCVHLEVPRYQRVHSRPVQVHMVYRTTPILKDTYGT